MKLTPKLVMKDLRAYVRLVGFRLSPSTAQIFLRAEEISYNNDTLFSFECVLLAIVKAPSRLQDTILAHGLDIKGVTSLIDEYLAKNITNFYDSDGVSPYSGVKRTTERTRLIDRCVKKARMGSRKQIVDRDVLEALLELPDEMEMPLLFKNDRTFNVLRRQINVALQQSLVEILPPQVRTSVFRLLQDFPNYDKNCFLIMSFSSSSLHSIVFKVLKNTLSKYEINLLRADKNVYSDDLLTNIEILIYGCSFAIAVFERIESEDYNPNVSFEVGYLTALKKPVCLLKEKTLRNLQSDLTGKLYSQFDMQDVEATAPVAVETWLSNKRII